ncbi:MULTISPECIES: DUF4177 domain-containing protein [Trichocoleus]|uniref:DUF4177 domain-containing protein n=1 Tax=Trichocoleus desertorum GB2-A4 TaxID=2933944 RepID=A0ABV0JGV5_9CYAN|nr:DUF4177 domain-containing protein [Trichocoleus sp. FACHB-46]MBD1865511.1 DUF4177 domain-containing protein [Trichocoleus sp. FACHB-46]
MGEWEYKTVKFFAQGTFEAGKINEIELEDALNEAGARGWELVSILPGTRANGELWDFVAVLKREVIS